MIPENERIEFEDRTYVNPEVGLQEQNAFIDNLRNVQNQNNAEIATDTYNLGTAIPSNLGGLGGGESYFTSRYQVPQGVALANNLRATAQAQALNDILSNEQAMMKQRYNNAYKAARRRAANSGGGGTNTPDGLPITGGVDEEDTSRTIGSVEPAFSPAGSGNFVFTPNSGLSPAQTLGGNGAISLPTNNLYPAGSVRVDRNKSGVVTGLIYNGKGYSGDAARKKYEQLQNMGDITPALGPVRR